MRDGGCTKWLDRDRLSNMALLSIMYNANKPNANPIGTEDHRIFQVMDLTRAHAWSWILSYQTYHLLLDTWRISKLQTSTKPCALGMASVFTHVVSCRQKLFQTVDSLPLGRAAPFAFPSRAARPLSAQTLVQQELVG